jgi:hypothetical protein
MIMTHGMEAAEMMNQMVTAIGISHVAYIKPISKGENGYAVCSSDGKQLAVFPNYDAAFFTARQYNLSPVNVH